MNATGLIPQLVFIQIGVDVVGDTDGEEEVGDTDDDVDGAEVERDKFAAPSCFRQLENVIYTICFVFCVFFWLCNFKKQPKLNEC